MAIFCYGGTFPVERDSPLYAYLQGIERQAIAEDYNLLLVTRGRAAKARSIYATGQRHLNLADGALIMGAPGNDDDLCRLVAEGYPFVHVGKRQAQGCAISWAGSDYHQAGVLATRHLIELGHRRLGVVAFAEPREEVADRIQGCRDAAREAGVDLAVFDGAILDSAEGLDAALEGSRITALCCGGMASLKRTTALLGALSIRVPDDLSLCALTFDEERLWPFQVLRPTYVRHQDAAVGGRAPLRAGDREHDEGALCPEPRKRICAIGVICG
jgi:DNA-binding LacI/PurR family transcriptional regulator